MPPIADATHLLGDGTDNLSFLKKLKHLWELLFLFSKLPFLQMLYAQIILRLSLTMLLSSLKNTTAWTLLQSEYSVNHPSRSCIKQIK